MSNTSPGVSGGGHSIDLARVDAALRAVDRLHIVMGADLARVKPPAGRDPLPDDVAGYLTQTLRRINDDSVSATSLAGRSAGAVRLGREAVVLADRRPWLADWVESVFGSSTDVS